MESTFQMSDTERIRLLEEELDATRAERNKYHAALTDRRLDSLEKRDEDKEKRIRSLEDIGTRFNTVYYLFAGNGLMSIIILFKLFAGTQ